METVFSHGIQKGKYFITSPNMATTGTIKTGQRKKNSSTSMVISFVGGGGDIGCKCVRVCAFPSSLKWPYLLTPRAEELVVGRRR